MLEAGGGGELLPAVVGDGVRDGGIASADVVFDDGGASAGVEGGSKEAEDLEGVALEVERVGEDEAVEGREGEAVEFGGPGEVGEVVGGVDFGEAGAHGLSVAPEGVGVAVDGMDLGAGAEEVGEGEGEGAPAGAEVGPDARLLGCLSIEGDGAAEEGDVVGVIQRSQSSEGSRGAVGSGMPRRPRR